MWPERRRVIATTLLLAALTLGAILCVGFVRAPERSTRLAGAQLRQANHAAPVPVPDAVRALAPVASHAGPPDCEAERSDALQAVRAQLRPDDSADSAFDSALLDSVLDMQASAADPRAEEAWRRARSLWPGDLDIAWFAARNCHSPRCDVEAALDHLLALDGDNAAAWMLAMADAQARGDGAAYSARLRQAAAAGFYDARVGVVFVHLQPVLTAMHPIACMRENVAMTKFLGHPPTHLEWATAEASSMELAYGMPEFNSLLGCRPDRAPMDAARRQDCLAVARRVAAADTLLERVIALPLVVQLSPDGPQRDDARERYREAQWLVSSQARLPQERSIAPELGEGEVSRLQSRAAAAGMWPPPPGWLPADPRARALVLTGNGPASR